MSVLMPIDQSSYYVQPAILKYSLRVNSDTEGLCMAGWGPFDLTEKNAVVTGGAMGIGFGIAKRLFEAGANVLIADIDGAAAQAAAKKLVGGPGKAAAMQADIVEEGVGQKIVAKCVELFGSINILVNNAGIYPMSPVLQMTSDFLDRVYKINLKGLIFVSKAAAARMVEQGKGGKIINISSIDAFHPSMPGLTAYDASKGGVVMFTKGLALELAPYGIMVNSIAPGGIQTEGTSKPLAGMTKEQMDQAAKAFVAKIPLRRMGVPDDIGKVAVFLASSASDYMTGETVIVDGGMLLA
jgi:2-deoxy-D-gluconate 3-dehydrogenase